MIARRTTPGFTIIELVSVLVVLGIVASVAGIGIVEAVKAYRKTIDRSELADMADGALRRIARDLRYSLPMSTRTTTTSGVVYLETIVSKNGGRYRKGGTELVSGGSLIEDGVDNKFESLAALSEPPGQVAVVGDLIVTKNLHRLESETTDNAYTRGSAATYCATSNSANCNTAVITSIDRSVSDTTVFSYDDRLLKAGANQEFYILAATPAVTYVCTPGTSADGQEGTGTLKLYYNYAISLAQPVSTSAEPLASGKNAVLADYVSGCQADAQPEYGYAYMRVELRRGGETMSLYYAMQLPRSGG